MNRVWGLFAIKILFILSTPAIADDYHLKFVSNPGPEAGIVGLKWDLSKDTQEPLLKIRAKPDKSIATDGTISLIQAKTDEGSPYFVTLKGTYQEKSALFLHNEKVKMEPKGEFMIEVPVESDHEKFTLSSVDDEGNITKQKVELLFPEWEEFKTSFTEAPPKRWSVTPGLGVTVISYQQTGISLGEAALTAKVSGSYQLKDLWDIGANAFYTALPLSTTLGGTSIQFLGMNLRAGYKVRNLLPGSWSFSLHGGGYFLTSFQSSPNFGFQKVWGPQLYPMLSREFSQKRLAWIYLKYSPIMTGLSFAPFTTAEFAAGGGYSFAPQQNGRVVSATLDIAFLTLSYPGGFVQANSYSLGVNYRF